MPNGKYQMLKNLKSTSLHTHGFSAIAVFVVLVLAAVFFTAAALITKDEISHIFSIVAIGAIFFAIVTLFCALVMLFLSRRKTP